MRLRVAIAAVIVLAGLLGAVAARGELSQQGNLRISFKGGFSPHSLPRDRPAPVTVDVEGAIETTDGTHPPPVQRVEIALNSNGHLSTVGLPTCTTAQLQSTSTEGALARCRDALVGRGRFGADVEFPTINPFPAKGAILAFNGVQNGKRALLLHLYGAVPVQTTFVLPLIISNTGKGRFGTLLSARVPNLAGGLGSVTQVDLKIGREYSYRGKRRSFLSASCDAPAGFPGAVFTFARGTFTFADGRILRTTLSRDCRVR